MGDLFKAAFPGLAEWMEMAVKRKLQLSWTKAREACPDPPPLEKQWKKVPFASVASKMFYMPEAAKQMGFRTEHAFVSDGEPDLIVSVAYCVPDKDWNIQLCRKGPGGKFFGIRNIVSIPEGELELALRTILSFEKDDPVDPEEVNFGARRLKKAN